MLIKDKKIYRVNPDADKDRIMNVVRVNNEAIERGERDPVCIGGHTPGTGPTEYLTIDVGEGRNFRTDGEFILCDMEIDDAFEEAVKRHRGVSVELWADDRIYPICLLAHNRPALEIEPMKYSRSGEHESHILEEPEAIEGDEMDISAIKNAVGECLQSSELMAQMKALTENVTQLSLKVAAHDEMNEKLAWLMNDEEEEQIDPDTAGDNAATDPEKNDMGEEMPPEDPVPEHAEEMPAPDKNDMGAALPSGTNTFVPTTDTGAKKKKNYEELELESETYRLTAANQEAIAKGYAEQVATEANEKNRFAQENADLVRKYQLLERKNQLILLSGRYQFDPDKEMVLVENMTDEQFEAHKNITVAKYSCPPVKRAPVNVGELPNPSEKHEQVIPQSKVAEIAKYALEHSTADKKMSWDEARKAVCGG